MSAEPYVAVVGGMNLDIQGKSLAAFRAGDSNPGRSSLYPGGVGRNMAENLARLGARVELVTVLCDDELAPLLEASCASVGIGLSGSLRLEGAASPRYLCLLDSDGSLAGAVAAMEAMDELGPRRLDERAALLDSASIILVDANLREDSIRYLAERYPRGKGGPALGFDPVSVAKAPRLAPYLGSFAFGKPNRAEAALLAGLDGAEGDASDAAVPRSPGELTRALRDKGLGEAFVSLGAEGIRAEGPDGAFLARLRPGPGLLGEPVNASGAGDAACAAIAWGLLRGLGLEERCALALAAASVAAASEAPVNPHLRPALLREAAKGIDCERVS